MVGDPRPLNGEDMRLYHFTSHLHLPSILANGITEGDVPISLDTGFNSPWLTTDPNPRRQVWTKGSFVDKTAVRLTVEIPDGDTRLHCWSDIVREFGVDPRWRRALGKGSDDTAWYIYENRIPLEMIVEVVHLTSQPDEPEIPAGAKCVLFLSPTPFGVVGQVRPEVVTIGHSDKSTVFSILAGLSPFGST